MIQQGDIPRILRAYLLDPYKEDRVTIPIIIGDLPPEPADCVAVHTAGSYGNTTFFGGSKSISYPLLVFIIRSELYATGATAGKSIQKLLGSKARIDNIDVVPASTLIYLGRDPQRKCLFRLNYKIIIRE